SLQSGSLDALAPRSVDDREGILIGRDLASTLGVKAGDEVVVLTPEGRLSPMGMIPGRRRLRVAGIFVLGLFEFDSTYGFVSLDTAKRMLDKDQVDYLQVKVDDLYRAPAIARQISAVLGDQYVTQDLAERSEEHTSELQSQSNLVCRLLLEKKKPAQSHASRAVAVDDQWARD